MKSSLKKHLFTVLVTVLFCGLTVLSGCGKNKEAGQPSFGSSSAAAGPEAAAEPETPAVQESAAVSETEAAPEAVPEPLITTGTLMISMPEEPEKPLLQSGANPAGDDLIHEPEFGGVYMGITIEDFNALGFEYGDSVEVMFSNGFALEDIPYYNGYYTNNGEPLLIAYPGYPYIKAAINNGDDLWAVAGLEEGDSAEITLREKARYLDIQNARDIQYKDDRDEFPSDEAFANFRNITVGDLLPDMLYRSASPCDNQHKRAPYVDDLIEAAGVNTIINLADNEAKIGNYISREDFDSPYFLSLYEDGRVVPLALNMNYASDDFRLKVKNGMLAMLEKEGPYLIHCTEGKDRTGFVCMLLEALCGADYEEILDDYMITYDNYYKITREKDKARYDVIVDKVLDPMIRSMTGDENADIKTADLSIYAEKFLADAGMTEEEIEALKAMLTFRES